MGRQKIYVKREPKAVMVKLMQSIFNGVLTAFVYHDVGGDYT